MRAQLSNHDYEQLSAYIDGQLAPAEKRKLEERLRLHAELQAALDELSRTRTLLRSAPHRRAPRNFTLTPAMVGEQSPRKRGSWFNLFPVLSFTSAIATLALVASIVFQLLPGQTALTTAAVQPQSDRVASIVQQTMTAMQATAPAERNPAAPQAQKAAPETERSAQTAAPGQPAQAAPMAAAQPTATLVEQPMVAGAAPAATVEGTAMAANSPSDNNPPIILWNGSFGSQAGGYGGGGGEGPSLGPLLGPPSQPSTGSPALGKGGGGGAGAAVPDQGGSIVIPPQEASTPSAASGLAGEPAAAPTGEPAATTAPDIAPTAIAPAPVNPNISGTGPILGVPSPNQAGQIVERKAILGQPTAGAQDNSQPAQPQPTAVQPPASEPAPGGVIAPRFPAMAIGQGLLVLLAIGSGVAAFLVRRRSR